MDIFMSHTWPGNIRELRNVLERVRDHVREGSNFTIELAGRVWQDFRKKPGRFGRG